MKFAVLDFETFFSAEYELKKMTDAQIAAQPEVKESQPTVLDKKPLPSFRERVPAEKTGKHK